MECKTDHIGYLTDSIESSVKSFEIVGYRPSIGGGIHADHIQRCRICFMEKSDEIKIELVEPFKDNRSMQRLLAKQGAGPYHICYIVENIDEAYNEFLKQDFLPIFKPVEASAFHGRRICYFYKPTIGYIEMVESHKII